MKYLSTIICSFFLMAFGANISADDTREIQRDDSQAIGLGVNYGAMKFGGSALWDWKLNKRVLKSIL